MKKIFEMKSKEQAFVIAFIIIFTLILGLYLGRSYNVRTVPECYITTAECGYGYDDIGWIGNYWNIQFEDQYGKFSLYFIQCCRRPHYILQGIEPTLYVMKSFCKEIDVTKYFDEEGQITPPSVGANALP